jgi:chromosome segregation ATPase
MLGMTVLLLVPGPATLATDPGTAGTADTDLRVEAQAEDVGSAELRAQLDELSLRYDELATENATLQRSVDDLAAERDRLARSIERLEDIYEPLEADRQLLFELRKDLPDSRPEAEAQLERMRSLALAANPAQLGQLVDRLLEAAPAFLEWRFAQFATDTEAAQAYVESGAGAFDTSMTEFRNEVLMSVANRLDGLLTVLDRIR